MRHLARVKPGQAAPPGRPLSDLTLYINGARETGTGNGKRTSPHPFGIGQQTQSLMGKRM